MYNEKCWVDNEIAKHHQCIIVPSIVSCYTHSAIHIVGLLYERDGTFWILLCSQSTITIAIVEKREKGRVRILFSIVMNRHFTLLALGH